MTSPFGGLNCAVGGTASVGDEVQVVCPDRHRIHLLTGTVQDVPGGRNRSWYTVKLDRQTKLCKVRGSQLQLLSRYSNFNVPYMDMQLRAGSVKSRFLKASPLAVTPGTASEHRVQAYSPVRPARMNKTSSAAPIQKHVGSVYYPDRPHLLTSRQRQHLRHLPQRQQHQHQQHQQHQQPQHQQQQQPHQQQQLSAPEQAGVATALLSPPKKPTLLPTSACTRQATCPGTIRPRPRMLLRPAANAPKPKARVVRVKRVPEQHQTESHPAPTTFETTAPQGAEDDTVKKLPPMTRDENTATPQNGGPPFGLLVPSVGTAGTTEGADRRKVRSADGQRFVVHSLTSHEARAASSIVFEPFFQKTLSPTEAERARRERSAFSAPVFPLPNLRRVAPDQSVGHEEEGTLQSVMSLEEDGEEDGDEDDECENVAVREGVQGGTFAPSAAFRRVVRGGMKDSLQGEAQPYLVLPENPSLNTRCSHRVWRECAECHLGFCTAVHAAETNARDGRSFHSFCSMRCYTRNVRKQGTRRSVVQDTQATLPERGKASVPRESAKRFKRSWKVGDVAIFQDNEPCVVCAQYVDRHGKQHVFLVTLTVRDDCPQSAEALARLPRSQFSLDRRVLSPVPARLLTWRLGFQWPLPAWLKTAHMEDARARAVQRQHFCDSPPPEVTEAVRKKLRRHRRKTWRTADGGKRTYKVTLLRPSAFPYLPMTVAAADPSVKQVWNFIMSEECNTPVLCEPLDIPFRGFLDRRVFDKFYDRYIQAVNTMLGAHNDWREVLLFVWDALPSPCRERYALRVFFDPPRLATQSPAITQWKDCPKSIQHKGDIPSLTLGPLMRQPKKPRHGTQRSVEPWDVEAGELVPKVPKQQAEAAGSKGEETTEQSVEEEKAEERGHPREDAGNDEAEVDQRQPPEAEQEAPQPQKAMDIQEERGKGEREEREEDLPSALPPQPAFE